MYEMYDLIYQEYELIEDICLDLVWILLGIHSVNVSLIIFLSCFWSSL